MQARASGVKVNPTGWIRTLWPPLRVSSSSTQSVPAACAGACSEPHLCAAAWRLSCSSEEWRGCGRDEGEDMRPSAVRGDTGASSTGMEPRCREYEGGRAPTNGASISEPAGCLSGGAFRKQRQPRQQLPYRGEGYATQSLSLPFGSDLFKLCEIAERLLRLLLLLNEICAADVACRRKSDNKKKGMMVCKPY